VERLIELWRWPLFVGLTTTLVVLFVSVALTATGIDLDSFFGIAARCGVAFVTLVLLFKAAAR
jgi:ABC-type multidrug transport system permease subunit